MDGSRKIEVKQSALSSLKSELIRKKEECLLSKVEQAEIPRKKLKLLNKQQPHNETISDSSCIGDTDETDDAELLIKSRKCLENKARLYDERVRSAGRSIGEDDYESLVDFRQKNIEEDGEVTKEVSSDNNQPNGTCDEYGDDNDWVEYVDFFGRTRKCLKEDLESMKKIDNEFKKTLSKEPSQDVCPTDVQLTDQVNERPEFLQKLHEVWEEQEKQLKDKQDIHYQDVFFNEARAHGVGYYAFSTDERARATQQAALERLRQETKMLQQVAKQKAAQTLTQSTARVDAAKKRMLKLLQAAVGVEELNVTTAVSEMAASILTPVQAAMEATQKDVLARRSEQSENMEKEEESVSEDTIIGPTEMWREQEEEDLKRRAHIRPWDEGKDGISSKYHIGYVRPVEKEVMSQEKWIEKKREERHQEFSPFQEPDKPGVNLLEELLPAASKSALFFSSRKEVSSKSVPSRNKLTNKFQNSGESEACEVGYRAASHVPPISEFGPHSAIDKDPFAGMSPAEISEAVEAGLKYLRQKAEEKETKPEKGLMSIV